MLILLFSVLNDEQRALVERIFHEHHRPMRPFRSRARRSG